MEREEEELSAASKHAVLLLLLSQLQRYEPYVFVQLPLLHGDDVYAKNKNK
jgi:hypothetical protein